MDAGGGTELDEDADEVQGSKAGRADVEGVFRGRKGWGQEVSDRVGCEGEGADVGEVGNGDDGGGDWATEWVDDVSADGPGGCGLRGERCWREGEEEQSEEHVEAARAGSAEWHWLSLTALGDGGAREPYGGAGLNRRTRRCWSCLWEG